LLQPEGFRATNRRRRQHNGISMGRCVQINLRYTVIAEAVRTTSGIEAQRFATPSAIDSPAPPYSDLGNMAYNVRAPPAAAMYLLVSNALSLATGSQAARAGSPAFEPRRADGCRSAWRSRRRRRRPAAVAYCPVCRLVITCSGLSFSALFQMRMVRAALRPEAEDRAPCGSAARSAGLSRSPLVAQNSLR